MQHRTWPAAALAIAALITACGASAATANKHASAGAGSERTARSTASLPLEYSRCMRAHGIRNFPLPVDGHILLTPSSGIVMSSRAFVAAAKACARYGPSAPKRPKSPAGIAKPASPSALPTAVSVPSFAGWLRARARAGAFSGTVLVARAGRVELDRGYGLANRAAGVPNTAATRFCIASIGKLFTAVAIGQLVERREVAFGAPVGTYVKGLPAAIARITIAQLLDMTAGLGDAVLSRPRPPHGLAQMVVLIARERPQQAPGRRFLYSNDDYILLGDVIESVTGTSYLAYVRRHIFEPAGMADVGYSTYVPNRVPGMAHGYALVGASLRDIGGRPQIANPSGGAYGTARDLFRFAQALLDHRLLSAAMTAVLLKPRVDSPQPGGPPVDEYTYGFGYQKLNGVTFVGHNGGTPGYEGQLDIYPRSGDVAVVLTNQDDTMIPAIQRSEQMLTRAGA